jgi:hypothetical protein
LSSTGGVVAPKVGVSAAGDITRVALMLRLALAVALGFAAVTLVGSTVSVNAQDKEKKDKDVKKLEGKLTCTKCALSETDACGHALLVKMGEKEVKYYLVDKGGKEPYHGKCCRKDVDAIVTGKVVEKDKKKLIENPKVTFPKK